MENNLLNDQEIMEGMVPAKNAITMEAITFDGKDPDGIRYLLLLYLFPDLEVKESDEIDFSWKVMKGRQNVYDYLKDLIQAEALDPARSFIMAEDSTMHKSKTIKGFMETMKKNGLIIDNDDFDVSGYIYANDFDADDETDFCPKTLIELLDATETHDTDGYFGINEN